MNYGNIIGISIGVIIDIGVLIGLIIWVVKLRRPAPVKSTNRYVLIRSTPQFPAGYILTKRKAPAPLKKLFVSHPDWFKEI